jgi:hypothetical protein
MVAPGANRYRVSVPHRGLGLLHSGGRTFASRKALKINTSRIIHKGFCIPLWTPLKNL